MSKDVLQQRVSRALKGEKNYLSSIPEQVNMLCLTTEGLSLTLLDGEKNSRFTEPSIVENGTGVSGRPKGMPKLHHAVKKCVVFCVFDLLH